MRKNHPPGYVGKNGYRYIWVGKIRILEHRHVMEKHLGRKLKRSEIVHHKDGNKTNNVMENLEVLPNQYSHMSKHTTRFQNETHKECSKCLVIKPRSRFYFRGKGGHNNDLHQAYCKKCSLLAHTAWVKSH